MLKQMKKKKSDETSKEQENLTEFNFPYPWLLPELLFLNYKALKFMNNTGNL